MVEYYHYYFSFADVVVRLSGARFLDDILLLYSTSSCGVVSCAKLIGDSQAIGGMFFPEWAVPVAEVNAV